MGSRISRRELLKRIGAAGAAAGSFARPASSAQTTGQPSIVIAGQPIEVVITPASALTTRISLLPDGAQPVPSDGSLVERPWPAPAARLTRLGGLRTVASGQLSVEVAWSRRDGTTTAEALSLRVQAGNGLIQDLRVDQETAAVTFSTGDGPLLGLGEGGPQFDRRGSMVGARSGQGAYQLRTHGGRVPVQWLIDTSRGALFIHWPYGAFDLMGSEGRFVPSAGPTSGSDATPPIALPLDVFVVGTREPVAIMSEYAMLTGRPEMPPLWSLGYQQSHRTLASRDEILQEAKMFREKRLPCETLIYLGTGFCPSGWNTDNGEFTFNPKVFPDPKAVVDALHDNHFKVALHIVLEGRTLTGTVKDPCTAPPLPSGKTPDGQWPDDRQVSCYWPVHKPLFDLGVDGWWPDQGDGLDASSRLARNRMYWDGAREWRPGERPFALHRNGHAGMQRYASFLWSGDVYSTWETLKTHIPVAVNTGLSGMPYWGTDIGGFVPTK
ncbi:MAG TPA: TIM-barrel domain-containing protein, partial [Vicinamibacterales bacterium]|nr:TIM-barrel domain-containing protein [Vicinamibacterales bacterium]